MVFELGEMERVMRLQERSYGLLRWLNAHLRQGSLSFGDVHGAVAAPVATEKWLARNWAHIPPDLLPEPEARREFAHILVSYLFTSFTLPAEKQPVRESLCGCRCCSYLVSAHRLVSRQPVQKDRQRAHALKRLFLEHLCEDLGYPLEKSLESAVFSSKALSLELSYATYAHQLLRRTEFESQGCAVLVLWRDIAWEDGRKPKKKFQLSADRVLQAETTLRAALLRAVGSL